MALSRAGFAVKTNSAIAIDGDIDAKWNQAPAIVIDRLKNNWESKPFQKDANGNDILGEYTDILACDYDTYGDAPSYAEARIMWDDNNLYFLVVVNDPFLSARNTNSLWLNDSVDIVTAFNVIKDIGTPFTDTTHGRTRIRYDSTGTIDGALADKTLEFKRAHNKDNVTYATKTYKNSAADKGGYYAVEMKLAKPSNQVFKAGYKMMADFVVADDSGNDEYSQSWNNGAPREDRLIGRDFAMCWSDLFDKSDDHTNRLGIIELVDSAESAVRRDITIDDSAIKRIAKVNTSINFGNIKSKDEDGDSVTFNELSFTPEKLGEYTLTVSAEDKLANKLTEEIIVLIKEKPTETTKEGCNQKASAALGLLAILAASLIIIRKV